MGAESRAGRNSAPAPAQHGPLRHQEVSWCWIPRWALCYWELAPDSASLEASSAAANHSKSLGGHS